MSRRLHITNGQSTLSLLTKTGIAGIVRSGDDLLAHGPVRHEMNAGSWDDRSAWLARHHDVPRLKYLTARRDADALLDSFRDYDEVVFWFEYDLHCQVNLIHWLFECDRRKSDLRRSRLSLVCPQEIPDRPDFRGLGELGADELEWLYDQRQHMSAPTLALGREAWEAWADPTPDRVQELAARQEPLLPCLAPALGAHLERFPDRQTGLAELDSEIVDAAKSNDGLEFHKLFWRVANSIPLLGFGDIQVASRVRRLASGPESLVRVEPEAGSLTDSARWRIFLTDRGTSLVGEGRNGWRHFRACNGSPAGADWVGGVQLKADSGWVWDQESETVVFLDALPD